MPPSGRERSDSPPETSLTSPRSVPSYQQATQSSIQQRSSASQSNPPPSRAPSAMKQPQRIRVDRSSRQTTREHKSSDVQVETEDGEYENLSSGLVSAAASSAHSPQDPERQHVPVHEATKSVAKNVSQTASDLPASSGFACSF